MSEIFSETFSEREEHPNTADQKGDKRRQKMPHGGDRYRHKVDLDFSININPLGMPDGVKKSLHDAIRESEYYPDLHQEELLQALAKTFSIPQPCIVCGNGASELLMAMIHAFRPEKVLLPLPSFSGYQWVLGAENVPVTEVLWKTEDANQRIANWFSGESGGETHYDMIFLTNPNNPTGRYWESEFLTELFDYCEEKGTIVILDECFMELSDDPVGHSLISQMGRWKNLLILRAFTKSFAIPGVRLGYLLGADQRKMERIARHLPEWNLSVMAQKAGVACLKEVAYLEEARKMIREERGFLRSELEKLGFEVEASVSNFLLFRKKDPESEHFAKFLYEELLKLGTLIRDCSDYRGLTPGTCRIAVRTHVENQTLIGQMKAIVEKWKERKRRFDDRDESCWEDSDTSRDR